MAIFHLIFTLIKIGIQGSVYASIVFFLAKFIYILNGKQLEGEYKQELFEIDDENLKRLVVDGPKDRKSDKIVVKITTHKK